MGTHTTGAHLTYPRLCQTTIIVVFMTTSVGKVAILTDRCLDREGSLTQHIVMLVLITLISYMS